jgi:signal-transduction protein with cAMP-binding, CBS, and nucleotidyltransferase domain
MQLTKCKLKAPASRTRWLCRFNEFGCTLTSWLSASRPSRLVEANTHFDGQSP